MWIQIEHELRFQYADFISESRIELRVEPRTNEAQSLRSFALSIGPPTRVHRYTDWNGNLVHHFGIGRYHDRIEIKARSLVETRHAEQDLSRLRGRPAARSDLGPLLEVTGFQGPVVRSERLEALATHLACDRDAPIGEQLMASGQLIRERLSYEPGITDYKSTTDHLLESNAGVCQDFAHLQIALLRLRGIPTRYISGYLHLGTGADAQSHAWIEAHSTEEGWIAFDPTHARVPDEHYIWVASGRNYDDVAPSHGVYRGQADETLTGVVRTTESQAHAIADLHEALGQIDVPVYREIPTRRETRAEAEAARPDQQQSHDLAQPREQTQPQQQESRAASVRVARVVA